MKKKDLYSFLSFLFSTGSGMDGTGTCFKNKKKRYSPLFSLLSNDTVLVAIVVSQKHVKHCNDYHTTSTHAFVTLVTMPLVVSMTTSPAL